MIPIFDCRSMLLYKVPPLVRPIGSFLLEGGCNYLLAKQLTQERAPPSHSYHRPKIRKVRNSAPEAALRDVLVIKRGNKRAISISKIKKITPKRKNRREMGDRAFEAASNPHSNWVSVSGFILWGGRYWAIVRIRLPRKSDISLIKKILTGKCS